MTNRFKVGEKVVCTCGVVYCKKYFTVTEEDIWDNTVSVSIDDGSGEEVLSRGTVISRELYESPLYKALS